MEAQRTTCLNNLKQINLAFQLYAGANGDMLPTATNTVAYTAFVTNHFAIFYKSLVKTYVGLQAHHQRWTSSLPARGIHSILMGHTKPEVTMSPPISTIRVTRIMASAGPSTAAYFTGPD